MICTFFFDDLRCFEWRPRICGWCKANALELEGVLEALNVLGFPPWRRRSP